MGSGGGADLIRMFFTALSVLFLSKKKKRYICLTEFLHLNVRYKLIIITNTTVEVN